MVVTPVGAPGMGGGGDAAQHPTVPRMPSIESNVVPVSAVLRRGPVVVIWKKH